MKTRLLTATAVAIAFTLSAGAAGAATHRHHHYRHQHAASQAGTTSRARRGLHGRVEAAEETTTHARYHRHRWRHHRRPSETTAAGANRRHHHYWGRVGAGEAGVLHRAPYRHQGVAPAEATGTTAGTACQSVRIHGEWVQRCHFAGQ